MKTIPPRFPRRRVLQLGLGATAGILTTAIGCNNSKGEADEAAGASYTCEATPDQGLGPFYPMSKTATAMLT